MILVQTGNMLDVVIEGKSIGLKQRDSDHRKHEIIWLPDPEGLRDVLNAEIVRLSQPCPAAVAPPAGPQGDLISRKAQDVCWHCGVVLAGIVKPRCEDCPDECDEPDCNEMGCALPAGHPTDECVWIPKNWSGYWSPSCTPDRLVWMSDKWNHCPNCGKQLVEHPTGEKE